MKPVSQLSPFSQTYEKLWNKTIKTNNLIPVGKFEALPIDKNHNYIDYPYIIQMKEYSSKKLLEDFITSVPVLKNENTDLFKNYSSYYVNTNMEEIIKLLGELGFISGNYQIYSLWKFGSAELLPIVGDYTRICLNKTGCHFRQLYTVAQPGWCTKPHIDNKNIEWHGFKIQIPINIDCYFGYICPDGIKVYKLSKGNAYFCNTSIPHFGINPLEQERIALNFNISSDRDIFKGVEIRPEGDDENIQRQIPWREGLYENYNHNYQRLLK